MANPASHARIIDPPALAVNDAAQMTRWSLCVIWVTHIM